MEVRTELLRESKRRGEVIKGKLEELHRALPSGNEKSGISLTILAEKLLHRAPLEFLEERSAAELAQSVRQVNESVLGFLAQPGSVRIDTHAADTLSLITISISDRPFIVNTIMECCREERARVVTLLHPVFDIAGKQISTNYLEVERLEGPQLETLVGKLREALELLIPVTDDFSVCTSDAASVARQFGEFSGDESGEISAFLKWLTDGQFNFLGIASWTLTGESAEPNARRGLLRGSGEFVRTLLDEVRDDVLSLSRSQRLVSVNSLLSVCPVHRRVSLSNITIAVPGNGGRFHTFIGLFTSRALSQECSTIPLIRRKFQEIVKLEGFSENSHDYKSVANIIDSLPKEAALGLETEALRSIASSVLDVATSSETVTSVWADPDGRGVYILVVMMRSRFDSTVRESIEDYLRGLFGANPDTSEHHLDITNRPVVRLYMWVPASLAKIQNLSVDDIRARIVDLARSWYEDLELALGELHQNGTVPKLLAKYADAFPEEYRAAQSIQDCVQDIAYFETLTPQSRIQVGIANMSPEEPDRATIVVYSLGDDLTISRAVPVLENCGFEVLNERSWDISPIGGEFLSSNRFRVRTRSGKGIDVDRFTKLVPPAMIHALETGKDNDILNTLLLEAGLDVRAVGVLRTYCRFLWQVRRFASRFSIYRTVAGNPELAARLWRIFELLFDPTTGQSLESRRARAQQESAQSVEALRQVKDITSDRIFRSLLSLLDNTVRTNVYQNRGSVALKFRSEAIDIMPQPRPMFEIFVNSPVVEGVHLRSGMVARGGIRWSDRPDDYRNEVLGLMKTQRIKNALIVPTGAKGGFIVKNLPSDPKQVPEAVAGAYGEYVRTLLSIADNVKEGKVVRPDAVLAYEGDDPYFVVAADKGTATFSDTANKIAVQEFDFWLGDAFASGGSNGYDHKKYGITAKGAWECVKRSFRDIGKDFEEAPFTAVGIGDMAGDVFGNGLLLSDKYKLVAAFNHRHIFIDPDPDPTLSFAERKRLFELKGSQWSDYSASLISRGGAIYDRYEKEISLSSEARTVLGLGDDQGAVLNGDSLINCILKAPVDLLWNGGIGTYVKSRFQSHAEVNDGSNDAVRVNADELRCRVVGEGGNLGFTQLARIEFNRRGGSINTDAIDNSGGVDLSDHEVNIKILFSRLVQAGKITLDERNAVLRSMAHEVCEAVLGHNRSHALLLTLAARRSVKGLQYFQALLRDLVKLGYVNRSLDALPDDDELADRQKEQLGMTRPELAVCVATAKMWVKDALLSSDILGEKLLNPLLLEYFPTTVQERWKEEILAHPLAKNILASQIANTLVDGMGITALHRLSEQFAVTPARVIECALTAELLFNSRHLRSKLLAMEPEIGTQTFLHLVQSIGGAMIETTAWLVSRHSASTRLAALFERYRSPWIEIHTKAVSNLPRATRERYSERLKRLGDIGLDGKDCEALALFPEVATVFDLLWCSQQGGHSLSDAAQVYGEVSELLHIDLLLGRCQTVEARDRWEGELLVGTEQDIRGSVAELTMQLLSEHKLKGDEIAGFLQQTVALERWRATIEEANQRSPDVASLAVFARQLQGFARA